MPRRHDSPGERKPPRSNTARVAPRGRWPPYDYWYTSAEYIRHTSAPSTDDGLRTVNTESPLGSPSNSLARRQDHTILRSHHTLIVLDPALRRPQ